MVETLGTEGFHSEPGFFQHSSGGANSSTCFCGRRAVSVIFIEADAQLLCLLLLYALDWVRHGNRVAGVVASRDFQEQLQVFDRARHGPDDPDEGERTSCRRIVSTGGNSAGRGFESTNSRKMRGNADGTSAIAANSRRRHAGGDGRRFSST